MNKQVTAEEVLEIIQNMSNEEREKFLVEMFYKYYNSKGFKRAEVDWNE